MSKLKVALIQMNVVKDKSDNLVKAEKMIRNAANQGAKLVVLPEMFNCPYEADNFPIYAEAERGSTSEFLSTVAEKYGIYLVGGSIPEVYDDIIYNTSYVFDPDGKQIAKHRKMHLFDIDIEGGQYFKESDTLAAGKEITVFDTDFGKIGLGICYDIRFPELSRLMAQESADIIIFPGAFNMTTGPAHWELLFRSRALDNQVYAIGVAPARDMGAGYHSYGNSIIVNPWGEVIGNLKEEEGILVKEIDLNMVDDIRKQLPLLTHRRQDIYTLKKL